MHAQLGEQRREALAADDRDGAAAHGGAGRRGAPRRRPRARRRASRSATCGVHVGDVEMGDLAGAGEHGGRLLGLVGVDVHLQRGRVADDEHRVAERLQRRR